MKRRERDDDDDSGGAASSSRQVPKVLHVLPACDGAVNQRIEYLVDVMPVVIFCKSYCPFCRDLKQLLEGLGVEPFVVDLDFTSDGPLVLAALLEMTKSRTVPSVWIKGKYVGGNDATHMLATTGELQKRLGLDAPPPVLRSRSGRDITAGLSMGDEINAMVKDLILMCPAVIFSKSYCPACWAVKRLFERLNQPICCVELDQTADGAHIQPVLLEMTKQCTVPNIFIHGQHLGGNDDAQAKAATGELQTMLLAAGAAKPA